MLSENIKYLYDRGFFGMKLGLANINALLSFYNIDINTVKTVHIAGTNGKGSTANIISQVLTVNGYRTGLFTSPHLVRFNERIKTDGEEISDEELDSYIEMFREGIEKYNCTFFEANTAIAFKYFIDKKVDIAVIETGLGGRLDSTNVLKPILSVITGIGLDHQKQLGSSLIQIAREKAGIFKKGVPAVVNCESSSVLKKLRSEAFKKDTPFFRVRNTKTVFKMVSNRTVCETMFRNGKVSAEINLIGEYHKKNLRTALTALKKISGILPLDPEKISDALSKISIKGRMQQISSDPQVFIDAAHNTEGLSNLRREIRHINHKGRLHLVTGTVRDKDYEKILDQYLLFSGSKYLAGSNNPRILPVGSIQAYKNLKYRKGFYFYENTAEAYDNALKNYRKGDLIVVTGSHFILGDLMEHLKII